MSAAKLRHVRTLAAYAADLGLQDVRVEPGGKHPHLIGTTADGQPVRYVVPSTPSDGARGEANARADLRRLVQPPTSAGRKVGARVRKRPRRPRPMVLDAVALRAEMAEAFEKMA